MSDLTDAEYLRELASKQEFTNVPEIAVHRDRLFKIADALGQPDAAPLPQEPPPGLLMSIAIRRDHALGCPGYYDQPIFVKGATHAQRLKSALVDARRAYEEVAGYGFYKPAYESEYAALAVTAAQEGEKL